MVLYPTTAGHTMNRDLEFINSAQLQVHPFAIVFPPLLRLHYSRVFLAPGCSGDSVLD